MIQIITAGELTYDSRLQDHSLLALSYTAGLNKAGTATITMPPGHPAYEAYAQYKPIVSIYDNGLRVFRGRALKPDDDMLNRRTITCEGERCFFRDALMRPYLYQAAPDVIFTDVIGIYNSQVEADKRFVVGTVTVKDLNNYVRLESEKAEQVSNTIDKLVERCGGYIVFTDNENGDRVVSWLEKLNYSTNQSIDFGSNLVDFKRSTANEALATRIVPYGAKNEETGEYLTIESVNGGLDYIEDTEAIALRGIITKPVYYDDVTDPLNLKRKAEQDLERSKKLITGLTLTAADLAAYNQDFDTFRVGDLIRARSKPHSLDDDFLLTDLNVNLLNKGGSLINLGKEVQTLTGLNSKGDQATLDELRRTERSIRADYKLNIADAIAAAQRTLTSLIEQTSESIRLEVSETYATNGEVTAAVSSSMTQLSDSFTFTFNELKTVVDEYDAEMRAHIVEQEAYIRMENGDLILGKNAEGSMVLTLENDLIVFKKNGATFGWWDGVDFHTGNIVIEVNERAQFGAFAAIPRSGGNLSWLKVK